jgi:hypothetical protein
MKTVRIKYWRGRACLLALIATWIIALKLGNPKMAAQLWNFVTGGVPHAILSVWVCPMVVASNYMMETLVSSSVMLIGIMADERAARLEP